MSDYISRTQAIDALRAMQTYKMFAGDDMLLIDQAEAQTELMMLPPIQPDSCEYYALCRHGRDEKNSVNVWESANTAIRIRTVM